MPAHHLLKRRKPRSISSVQETVSQAIIGFGINDLGTWPDLEQTSQRIVDNLDQMIAAVREEDKQTSISATSCTRTDWELFKVLRSIVLAGCNRLVS